MGIPERAAPCASQPLGADRVHGKADAKWSNVARLARQLSTPKVGLASARWSERARGWYNFSGTGGKMLGGHRGICSKWSLATLSTDTTETLMSKTNMDLSELRAEHEQGDFLRAIAAAVLQPFMGTDVEGIIGPCRHECSGEHTT